MSRHTYESTKNMPLAMRDEIAAAMVAPLPFVLTPPLRLCRFADKSRGDGGAISPWWIREADLSMIFTARDASRQALEDHKSVGLSLDLVARMALGIPQEWNDGTRAPLDTLFFGDLKGDGVFAYVGKGREQRETAPNGISLKWSPWRSITQVFIPSLSSRRRDRATMQDVNRIMTLGANKYFVSHKVY